MSKKPSKNNNSSKSSKKIICFILIGILIIIGIGLLVFFLLKNKAKEPNDIVVSEVDMVVPLDKEDEAQAAKLIKENIVRISNKIDNDTTIIGTGFFIKEGYLVTNSHIVDILGDIVVEYNDGEQAKALLYSNSINYDLALLKVENVKTKALSFGNSNNTEVTNDVLSAGFIYNFKGDATISKGILSARRTSQSLTYLQSDISIDSGSSGGPLFNSKAEVIGINTFVTEKRNFAISLSIESANFIIQALLEEPNIEYLTENRPSNPINELLVEVGYTDDSNLQLYDDEKIINKSKKENEEEFEEIKKENDKQKTEKKESYYCESGYKLIGKSCFKEEQYAATVSYDNCKEGYKQDGNMCSKTSVVDAIAEYPCQGKLTENKTCVTETIQVGGGQTVSNRWGSCPKGKKCYDMGKDYYTNTLYKKFISDLSCPTGSTKITTSIKYVWNGEELNETNIKKWNTKEPGAHIEYDPDGTEYYVDTSNVLSMCSKSYDSELDAHVLYKYDDLKNTACPNGGTLTANYNNQGFYCLISTTLHMYAWDPVCLDSSYSWIQYGGTYYCGRIVEDEHPVAPNYSCPNGSMMRSDGKTCSIDEEYELTPNFSCKDENDRLSGSRCYTMISVPANKK